MAVMLTACAEAPPTPLPEVNSTLPLSDHYLAFCGYTADGLYGQGNIYLMRGDGSDLVQANVLENETLSAGCTPTLNDVTLGAFWSQGLSWNHSGADLFWGEDVGQTIYSASVSEDGTVGQTRPLWDTDGWEVKEFESPTLPALSPDGKLLALAGQRSDAGHQNVWIVNPDGTNELQVSHINKLGLVAYEPIWSPDGNWLAFAYSIPFPGLGIAAVDNSKTITLTKNEEPAIFGVIEYQFASPKHIAVDQTPSWYPDGQRVIFVGAMRGNDRINTLFRYSIKTDHIDALINSNVYSPALSPDGTKIAFVQYVEETFRASAKLMLADGDGNILGELAQFSGGLGRAVIVRDIEWSPDGAWLAFSTNHERDTDIYVIRADGKDLQNVTNQVGMEVLPRWRPLNP